MLPQQLHGAAVWSSSTEPTREFRCNRWPAAFVHYWQEENDPLHPTHAHPNCFAPNPTQPLPKSGLLGEGPDGPIIDVGDEPRLVIEHRIR